MEAQADGWYSGNASKPVEYTAVEAQQTAAMPTPPDDPLSSEFFGNVDELCWADFMGDLDLGFLDAPMQ